MKALNLDPSFGWYALKAVSRTRSRLQPACVHDGVGRWNIVQKMHQLMDFESSDELLLLCDELVPCRR